MSSKDGRKLARYRRGASALVALSLYSGAAKAQSPPPAAPTPALAAVSAALGHMKAGGAPLVVVVTSTARPESRGFGRALIDGPWARANRGLVQVVELPAEGNAAMVERLRVTATPAVLAYTMGPEGPACRGMKVGGTADEAAAWLGMLGLGDARASAGTVDPAVIPANHDGYPSPQQPYSQPVAPPPSIPQYPAQGTPAPPYSTPAPPPATLSIPVAAQASAPASFVQLPGPNVVVQQGEARVFVAPPAGASMSVPAAASGANLYLPVAAAPAPAATAAFTMAPAAAPVAAFAAPMAPAMAVAAAPAAVGAMPFAAVTNQTIGVPSSGTRTRIRVRGPGPIRSGLASLGEKMVLLGRARIETVQETELNTPSIQGSGNIATFSTSSATPFPPQMSTPPASMPPQSPPPVCQPPPVTPSPQQVSKHGHLFGN